MKQPRVPITLSPQGHLHLDETVVGGLEPRLARELRDAAGQSSAQVLLVLATHGLGAALPPAGAFWRELGRRYFTKLCHSPELAAVKVIGAPPDEELQTLADGAPPMVGAEYLRVETLTRLWGELDAAALGAMRAEAGGPAAWLAAQNPLWRQVGRVTFHLAENKRDAERPFAFLATYTHRLSEQAKPQYLPLGRALQEYAGAGNRAALLTLLAPVQRAAEQSTLARGLVEAQRVFQPQTWTAREGTSFSVRRGAM